LKIDKKTGYLFLTNHRNYRNGIRLFRKLGLYLAWFKYGYVIADRCDNLLRRSFCVGSDLMRLNKSFIVKRSCQLAFAKLMAAFGQLSGYILIL